MVCSASPYVRGKGGYAVVGIVNAITTGSQILDTGEPAPGQRVQCYEARQVPPSECEIVISQAQGWAWATQV